MAGRTKTKTLLVFTLLICSLLLPTAVLATNGFDADKLRAQYTSTLVELAGSYDYVIECGNSDVLNSYTTFSELELPLEVAVCTLKLANNNYAVIFSSGDEAKVLDHLPRYFEDDEAADPSAIYPSRMNMGACDDPQTTGDDWRRCTNAIKNNEVSGYDTHVFARLDLHSITYLVTINFVPEFGQGWWSNFLTTLRNLFRLGDTTNDIIEFEEGFARGYFAKITEDRERRIQGTFQANNPTSNGRATIIFENFATNMSQIIPDATHRVGQGIQEITFQERISPQRWKQLTAQLRITPTDDPPLPGPTCGEVNYVIPRDDCYPGQGNLPSCQDIGFVGGELSCGVQGSNNECRFDISSCFMCQDRDDDGYPTNRVIPTNLRAIMNNPLFGSSQQNPSSADTAHLITINELPSQIRSTLNSLTTQLASTINSEDTLLKYQEAAGSQQINVLVQELHTHLEASTPFPMQQTPIVAINVTNLVSTFQANNDVHVENALKTALFCSAIARATILSQQESNNLRPLFLFYLDGVSETTHIEGYRYCRAGVRSIDEQVYFTNPIQKTELFQNQKPLFDGLVTTSPEDFVRERLVFDEENMTFRDVRRALNGQLIVKNNDIISAFRANPQAIIVSPQATQELAAIRDLLIQNELFIPRSNTLTTSRVILSRNEQGQEKLFLSAQNTQAINAPGFDLACIGLTQEPLIQQRTGTQLFMLRNNLYVFTPTQTNCLVGPFPQGSCPLITQEKPGDCNDNNPRIYPGAPQLCDGLDNNCDENATNPSFCELAVTCNFDGVCDPANEDIRTCEDCTLNTCPTDRVPVHRQGGYDFFVRFNERGMPELVAEYTALRCADKGGKNYATEFPICSRPCDWANGNTLGDSRWDPPRTKTFEAGSGQATFFANQGSNSQAYVHVSYSDNRFIISYEDKGSSSSRSCWDFRETRTIFSVNPFEVLAQQDLSCRYFECFTDDDCPNGFCVTPLQNQENPQIRYCDAAPQPPGSGSGGSGGSGGASIQPPIEIGDNLDLN